MGAINTTGTIICLYVQTIAILVGLPMTEDLDSDLLILQMLANFKVTFLYSLKLPAYWSVTISRKESKSSVSRCAHTPVFVSAA